MKRTVLVPQYARALTAVFALILFAGIFAPQAGAGEANVYLAVDHYTWKEFDDNGSRLLRETGPLVGVGFVYWKESADHVTLKPSAEIFGGTIDYDGQACSTDPVTFKTTCQPATTKVDYFGIKLEGEVGRRFRPGQSFFVEPFGGLGLRFWDRSLRNGTAADGSATSGYLERWFTFYARLGLRGGIDVSSRSQVFTEAGVKLPVYTENTAYVSNIGYSNNTTVQPGNKASLFAEAGFRIQTFKMSLFYDAMRFSKSNYDYATQLSTSVKFRFNQPESTADIYGVKAGFVF